MDAAYLTGIPKRSIFGPVIYRRFKELGSPGLIAESPKHRRGISRIRVAFPVQLRSLEKLLEPKNMGLPDTAYAGPKLTEDPRSLKPYGTSQLAKALATYDRSDPGAGRVVIVVGSDFTGTSPKLICFETLVYLLSGAEISQMLTLAVAMKSETQCESEELFSIGLNDHLHAAVLLQLLRNGEPTPRKIWEAVQSLFASMNQIHELVAARLGTSSPGYSSMPPAVQFAYAILVLIAEGSGLRMLVECWILKSVVAAACHMPREVSTSWRVSCL